MNTVDAHPHDFAESDWPFSVPSNTTAFSSGQVMREGAPVLVVCHDHDGEWQFLHGDVLQDDECLLICMGCAFQRTPAIAALANMPSGWRATRTSVNAPWVTEPYDDSGNEA